MNNTTVYEYSQSVGVIEMSAIRAVHRLTRIPMDAIVACRVKSEIEPISDVSQFATRNGTVSFNIGSNPKKQIKVLVQIVRPIHHDDGFEIWIPRWNFLSTPGFEDWNMVVQLNARTGEPSKEVEKGEFPFTLLCNNIVWQLESVR